MQIYKKKRKSKKNFQKYCHIKKKCIFAASKQAEVAQLVEHNLAKVGVASPSLVFRSTEETLRATSLFLSPHCAPSGRWCGSHRNTPPSATNPTLRSLRSLVRGYWNGVLSGH